MKERPILFSAPMSAPYWEGRKTQTRRIIKGLKPGHDAISSLCPSGYKFDSNDLKIEETGYTHNPYGVPGDSVVGA